MCFCLSAADAPRPNIIFILTDDLGYGDLGIFFQNSRLPGQPRHATPQLDTLAAQGLQMRRHYCAAPVCAPSRASLLTGVHQGHATVRDNQFDKALENNHTLATVLKAAGYATAAFGKWGLQGSPLTTVPDWEAHPLRRGFDYYYGYIRHGDGHEHYPKEDNKQVYDNYTDVHTNLDLCYTTDLFTARAKKWLVDHRQANPAQPAFIYLAYDTPHASLRYPPSSYPPGGGTNGGVQWLGIPGQMINTAAGAYDAFVHPQYASATYDDDNNSGTPEVPWPEVFKRFATSVRRVDDAVGDLVQLVNDLGIATNTLIVFSSDNGPHIEDYLTLSPNYSADFFDNFGPLDGIKRDCWEGGVRMPTLAWWPGTIPAGTTNWQASGSWDWLPTFAALAGVPPPARTDGVSLVPALTGSGVQPPSTIYIEYFYNGSTPSYTEFEASRRGRTRGQMQVIHQGDFKGVRYNIASHADAFEIYNLATDSKEATNLGASPAYAALQQQMKDRVLQVRRPDGSAPRPYDQELVPPSRVTALTNGWLDYTVFEGTWPWLPDFAALSAVSTGRVAGLDLAVRTRETNFGVRFTGCLEVPEDGTYTFYMRSDAGAQLRIHDVRVIEDDFHHDGSEVQGSLNLRAGRHPVKLDYRHGAGPLVLDLQYSGPGISRRAVPVSSWLAAGTGDGAPFAGNDRATTPRNVPVFIPVLANDVDDGLPSPLSISAVGTPLAGAATKVGTQVNYTPNSSFLGEDRFYYAVTDGQLTRTGWVTVSVVLTNDLIWFPFNETKGFSTLDAGGNRTALLQNFDNDPAQWVAGRWNRALAFDGADDVVRISGFAGILGSAPRTVSAWIRTSATNQQAVVGWGTRVANGNKWSFILNASGNLRQEVESGYIIGTRVNHDGQWHHVAVSFPGGASANVTNASLYVDGVLDPVGAQSARAVNTAAGGDVMVGNDVQDRYFAGVINELRIYSRALSASEVAALAAATNQSAVAWHYRYFDDVPADWAADDDSDGAARLAEYAFGGQPFIADAERCRLSVAVVGGLFEVRFNRRATGTHELFYTVEASSNLVHWAVSDLTEQPAVALDWFPGFEEALYRGQLPASPGALFVRVRISFAAD